MAYRVVCAIDFGTHGSGFAWCSIDVTNADPLQRDIYFFDGWQDQPTTYPKNLSALLLDADGEVLEWGFRARKARAEGRGDRLYHGFKMWLKETQPVAGELSGTPEQAYPLIVAYLKRLREVALENITNGGYLPDDIRWCLTVPAMWESDERNLMRRAAVEAGFPADYAGLLLVPEPEAATVFASAKGALITASGPVMVVDCGGGTVDIASYQPHSSGGSLKELGRPEGRRLGSEYINQRFRVQYLQPRLGPAVVEELTKSSAGGLQRILDQFEQAKIGYSVDVQRLVDVPLDVQVYQALMKHEGLYRLAEQQEGGATHAIVLLPQDLQAMFEEVVAPLLRLVEEQINFVRAEPEGASGPLSVVLVGGFAQSPYLQRRAREFLRERCENTVLVVLPDAARAVLGGAVHYAYDPKVVLTRKARCTYGVRAAKRIERQGPLRREVKDHRVGGKMIKDARGIKRRTDRFQVFVRAGESVAVEEERSRVFRPVFEDQTIVEIELYSASAADPQFVSEAGARRLATIAVHLDDAMQLPFERRAVRVAMRFGATEIQVTASNVETGKEQPVVIAFEADDVAETETTGRH